METKTFTRWRTTWNTGRSYSQSLGVWPRILWQPSKIISYKIRWENFIFYRDINNLLLRESDLVNTSETNVCITVLWTLQASVASSYLNFKFLYSGGTQPIANTNIEGQIKVVVFVSHRKNHRRRNGFTRRVEHGFLYVVNVWKLVCQRLVWIFPPAAIYGKWSIHGSSNLWFNFTRP